MTRSFNENKKKNNLDDKNLLFRRELRFNAQNDKDKDLLYGNDQHRMVIWFQFIDGKIIFSSIIIYCVISHKTFPV